MKLNKTELKEHKNANNDYMFYEGIPKNLDKLMTNGEWDKDNMIGQYWLSNDEVDYEPAKDVRNKVKRLLNKQKRFMFGKEPTILFKPYNPKDKDKCEALRQFIDNILEENDFWNETAKAFLESTIRKRVLLRCEINKKQPIYIYYNDINDFSYISNSLNTKKLDSVSLVFQDKSTIDKDIENQMWNRYTYFIQDKRCKLKIEIFKGNNLDSPLEVRTVDTGLDMLPFWLIKNGGTLNNNFGESDITDLRSPQTQYNKKNSDFADNLKFNQFPPNILKDVEPVTNNTDEEVELKIAPNAIWILKSTSNGEGKSNSGEIKKLETNFTATEAVEKYLDRAERDMEKALDIPSQQDVKNAPSAKAMKYIYTDLIARCEEKWRDWENPIRQLIKTIIYACSKFNCYENWEDDWNNLKFKIVIKHNYPLIEDEEDKKKLALEEVNSNVRSHKSYIKDFSDTEDIEGEMNDILSDIKDINNAENDQYNAIGDE